MQLGMLLRIGCRFSKLVKLSQCQGKYGLVAKLQLDNPKKKNALSVDLLSDLEEAIGEINRRSNLRACIVKSSQEGYFCSGADLKERLQKQHQELDLIVNNLRRIFNDFRHIHCPTICVIDGPALGGGLELALNSDIRIATASALLGLVETNWSLIPGGGGTQTLSRTIGIAKAKELIFTARKITGVEALDMGIVNYTLPTHAEAEAKAFGLIDEMLQKSPIAIEHAKRAINWGFETDLKTGLEFERLNYERVLYTEDRKEGFKAFAEKRQPKYQGK